MGREQPGKVHRLPDRANKRLTVCSVGLLIGHIESCESWRAHSDRDNDCQVVEVSLKIHFALASVHSRSIQYGRGSQSMSTWQIDRSGSASMGSEEHTSELQSHNELVFRLSLAKKKTISSTARHLSIARSYCRE